jgi:hypothetical protein
MDLEPVVRARHLRDWLTRVGGEEDPWRGRFFAALPARTRTTIETAARGTWLPMQLHVDLAEVMLESYGPARAHEHYRRSFAAALQGGIFGPLVRTGNRLFGTTPATFLRWAHLGWDTSFRQCGELTGEITGAGQGRLIYSGLPRVCTVSDAWLDSSQGSSYGCFDVLEIDGLVRVDKSRREEGRLELALEWSERA